MPDRVQIDHKNRIQGPGPLLHIELLRTPNKMIEPLEGHLEHIIFVIVGDAVYGKPFCFDLIAKIERSDLDLGAKACERVGYTVAICLPLFFGMDLMSGS